MKTIVFELYHWVRCMYLSKYGVPLDAFDFVYRALICEMLIVGDMILHRYRWKLIQEGLLPPEERLREWHKLTPGQQYREHMRHGGYRK